MKKILLLVMLVLFISFVMAIDGNSDDSNTIVIACTTEGQSMPVYPGYTCCTGLVAINPQTTSQPLVGASICSNCGNETCEQWENQYNCPSDCESTDNNIITACTEDAMICPDGTSVGRDLNNNCNFYPCPTQVCTDEYAPVCGELSVQCVTTPCNPIKQTYSNKCELEKAGATYLYSGQCGSNTTIKEQVKCVFANTTQRQKCYSFFGNETFSCTNDKISTNTSQGTCVADVAAPKGTKLVWKSSCDGYATTIVDGVDEYAKFDCEKESECVYTTEYAPVCGTIELCTTSCTTTNISSNEVSTCSGTCYKERKTYSNAGEAKCAGATDITKGKCEQTCPIYEQPYCPNGKIEAVYDSDGCKKPKCVAEEEHFTGAYWQCSNGKEFKEVDTCMPYSFWKNKARNTCAQYSTKCASSGSGSGNVNSTTSTSPGTGNFILDAIATVTGTGTVSSTTVDSNTTTKCIGGEVYVTNFETFGSCTPGKEEKCKYYVNENGCKVKECIDGTGEESCPTDANIITTNTYKKAYWQCYSGKEFYEGGEGSCKPVDLWKQYAQESCNAECNTTEATVCDVDSNVCETSAVKCGVNSFQVSAPCYDGKPVICSSQNEGEIKAAKEKCYANNGELKVEIDSQGCRAYTCGISSNECITTADLSEEKKFRCEERGGELVTQFGEDGCLVYLECIGEQINDTNASINKEVLTDTMTLLDLAIKIESAKIELENTANKVREIAIYYEGQGKMEDANRFYKAANILEAAAQKLEEIKLEIKSNVDNFGEERALKIRELIRNIKEDLLKEALLEMLG